MFEDMRGVMVRYPYVAGPEMTLAEAEVYMKECEIRHLPIISDNKIVGLVSERDLLRYQQGEKFSTLTLGEIIHCPPFVVSENEPLKNVLGIMVQNKYGSALIINQEAQLVGIFTTIDALKILQNLISGDPIFFKNQDSIVILKDVVSWN